ncbi:MAG: TIGR03663 family protein, partial [Anaerolineae bacterium]|nr:TIGR03663 family protein [Anaerolineae bacterium]
MELSDKRTIFDRPLTDLLKPSWEKAFYFVIFLVAIVTRFWDLGARAMSHDESLHALYSFYLYNGTGYQHNPMMHGPFLFHASALIYFLFGVTDYTARIVPAIFGVLLVFSPLLLKPWLGRVGAALTSLLLLISPAILYHSRYIRNDIYMALWTVLLIAALFYYLRDRRPGWLVAGAAVLMLSMATKETAYIFGWMGLVFLVMAVVWQKASQRNHIWLFFGGAIVGLALWAAGYVLGHVPIGAGAAATVGNPQRLIGSILVMLGGSLLIAAISSTLIRSRRPRPAMILEAIQAVPRSTWIIALVAIFIIYSLLFTTFFTNPPGFITGIAGSISYWMAQQNVVRGDQPWYYYFLTLTMYEYLPFLFGIIATIYYLVRRQPAGEQEETEEPGGETVPYRDSAGTPRRRSAADNPSALGQVYTGTAPVLCDTEPLFIAFLVFWNLATLFLYSWAGERMAWLTVHPALSMIVITGKFGGELLERVDWREAWRRGGAVLALLLPVTFFGILSLITKRPFRGLAVSDLQATGSWLAALLVTLLLVALTVVVARRLGRPLSLSVAVATLFLFLAAFTVRTAWTFAYITYDYSTELMTFAHGTPDVTRTMDEIAEISRRIAGDKLIKVAYDSDVSWPLEWYMREYPNRVFYGENPSREKMDVPIVLAGDKNNTKVEPYLADRYLSFKRRLVWWPTYDYRDLTPKRIWEILTTAEKRQKLWDILYWREYPRSTDDWYYVHNF